MPDRPVHTGIDAVIFDLDGVLTDTAEYHYRAWKRLAEEEGLPFDRQMNERLRGVSRARSLEILLNGRQVPPQVFQEMLERKNRYYRESLQTLNPKDILPGALELVRALRTAGLKVAIGTVSKNAPLIVDRLGLRQEIDVLADGHSVGRSKPSPDIFLYAALQLGVTPERAVVVEDAAAGIDAALAAHMWAVGIGPEERVGHAHVVFPDLEKVTLSRFVDALERARQQARLWSVVRDRIEPDLLPSEASLFAIGNGYVGTRGTLEIDENQTQRATLLHGLWDDVPIFHTELVNAPDWTAMDLTIDGERVRLHSDQVIGSRRELSLRDGRVRHTVRWRGRDGARVDITWERFAAWQNPHALAQRMWLTPLDRPIDIRVHAYLQGWMSNPEVLHWQRQAEGRTWVSLKTRHTNRTLVIGQEVIPWGSRQGTLHSCTLPGQQGVTWSVHLAPREFAGLDRLVLITTDRDSDLPPDAVEQALTSLTEWGYDRLLSQHRQEWRRMWQVADVVIEGDEKAQRAIRFDLYHLLIAAPRGETPTSIGAKTLTGFGYRGHIFWDTEIFMLPFFTYVQPETARRLLMYRHETLPGARRKAARNGYAGAQFAWESAETGDEVTPRWVPLPDGPLVRIWCGDIEFHICSDIPYALWQYWRVTGDDVFLRDYGARIILETARFWETRVEWSPGRARYEIRDVIGPDEYHEHVDNNAFTNEMVRWHLERALDVLTWLQQNAPERLATLSEQLDLTPERLAHWQHIRDHLFVPYDPQSGLIEQFDGFFRLEDIDLTAFEPRHQSMQALLGIEGANQRQVLKQPDVLMLLYLLPDRFGPRALQVNWDYYAPRTDHTYGSSLGPSIHAILAAWQGKSEEAYTHFMRSALADLEDVRGNAVDGIHGASCGGTWQAVVFGFAGLRVTPDGWSVVPHLPPHWRRVKFHFYYRGALEEVEVTGEGDASGGKSSTRTLHPTSSAEGGETRPSMSNLE